MTRKLPADIGTVNRGNLSPVRKALTVAMERMGFRRPPLTDEQQRWLIVLQTSVTRVR
jgi:hypothetical protein